jgi:hypothetical protein
MYEHKITNIVIKKSIASCNTILVVDYIQHEILDGKEAIILEESRQSGVTEKDIA